MALVEADPRDVKDPPRYLTILSVIWTALCALPFWLWVGTRAAVQRVDERNPYAENDVGDVWLMWAWLIGMAALVSLIGCAVVWGVLTLVSR